ncbi:MAG: hypothetical protein ACYDCN_02795 [Bacteroidia bacterium]
MKKTISILVLSTLLFSSCFVNRTTVGYGPVGASIHDRTYSKAKQHYLLFGLISLNHPRLPIPPINIGYEIKSSFSLWDGFITLITIGIYGQRTERILVNNQDEKAIQNGANQNGTNQNGVPGR